MQKGARGKKKGRERSGKKEKGVKITKEGGKVEKRKGEKTGGRGGGGVEKDGRKKGGRRKKGEKNGRNNGEMRGKGENWGKGGVEWGQKKPWRPARGPMLPKSLAKKNALPVFLTAILPKFWAKKIQSLAVRIRGLAVRIFFGKKTLFGEKSAFLGKKNAFSPNKTRVLRQIAPESSPERSAKSLSHNFFVVRFLSPILRQVLFHLPTPFLQHSGPPPQKEKLPINAQEMLSAEGHWVRLRQQITVD